jgi:hypothetical protein
MYGNVIPPIQGLKIFLYILTQASSTARAGLLYVALSELYKIELPKKHSRNINPGIP